MLGVGSTNLSESKFTNVKDENGTNNLDRVIWADASNNGSHSAVIKTDGDVYAWGLGTQGQIGNGGLITAIILQLSVLKRLSLPV